jgi:hypothetical protein
MLLRAPLATNLTCAALVAAALLACKKKSEFHLTATPASIAGKYSRLSIGKVEECDPYYVLRPKPDHRTLAVELTIESTASESTRVFKAIVSDASGGSYEAETGLSCEQKQHPVVFFANPVPAHQKAHGWVAFQVPKDATGLKVTFKPGLSESKAEPGSPWLVPVYDQEQTFALNP